MHSEGVPKQHLGVLALGRDTLVLARIKRSMPVIKCEPNETAENALIRVWVDAGKEEGKDFWW